MHESIETAFRSLTRVLLGKELHGIQSYSAWLERDVRMPTAQKSAVSDKMTYLSFFSFFQQTKNRVVKLEEGEKLGEKAVSREDAHRLSISNAPGLLRGNTSVQPLNGGEQFLITDTLEKKIMIVDRATKNIVWEWSKPDSQWLEHVFATQDDTFILEDRLAGEVFEINRDGETLWTLKQLTDGSFLKYPTDTAKLDNDDVLIVESGRQRVIEVVPQTGKIVRQFSVPNSLLTSIAVDYQSL